MVAALPRMLLVFALATTPSADQTAAGVVSPATRCDEPLIEPDTGRIGRGARHIALVRARRLEQILDYLRYFAPEPALRMRRDLSEVQDHACALFFLCSQEGRHDRALLHDQATQLVAKLQRLAADRARVEAETDHNPPKGLTRGKLRSCWELFSLDLNKALQLAREIEAELGSTSDAGHS